MSTRSYRLIACIATAVLSAAAGSPAGAGSWGSSFDPIGMHGTDLINISGSDCLPGTTAGGFFYVNGFGANNCVVSLVNADVTLTSVPETTDTAQLTFGPSTAIWGIDLAPNGTLTGVDSFQIGPKFAPEGSNVIFNGPWWIQLDAGDGQAPPSFADPGATFINTVLLFSGSCDPSCFPDSQPVYTAHVIGNEFVPVPEPGSLGLLFGALGAVWLTRRRKAAA